MWKGRKKTNRKKKMRTRLQSRYIRRMITSVVLDNRDLVAAIVSCCGASDVASLQCVANIFYKECVAKKHEWTVRTKQFNCTVHNIGTVSPSTDTQGGIYTRKFSAIAWTGEMLQWSLLVFPYGNNASEYMDESSNLAVYLHLITNWISFTRCTVKFSILVGGNDNHVWKTFSAILTKNVRDWGMRDFCTHSEMCNCVQADALNFVVEIQRVVCT